MNTFEINKGYFTIWDGKTKYDYHVNNNHNYDNFLNPETLYEIAISHNLTEDATIKFILKNVHKRRIIKTGVLANKNSCIVFLGSRGSGKSAGATQVMCIDGLLACRKVVSNLPIGLRVKYKDAQTILESIPLDPTTLLDINDFETNYQDCWILIDETNVNIADSQRTMANQALYFSHVLQQMRHRNIDFAFTTQKESTLTGRTWDQIDIAIKCADKSSQYTLYPKQEDEGRKSEWRIYNISGLIPSSFIQNESRKINELKPYGKLTVWNTPFWNCFSTEKMQVWEKYDLRLGGKKQPENTGGFAIVADRFNVTSDVLKKSLNLADMRFTTKETWDELAINENIGMQKKTGKLYKNIGVDMLQSNNKRYYIFPSKNEMIRRIIELSLEIELEESNV